MTDVVIQKYKQTLDGEIEKLERFILAGKCPDHAWYLARISELHAYKRAKDNFARTLDDYLREEDNLSEEGNNE